VGTTTTNSTKLAPRWLDRLGLAPRRPRHGLIHHRLAEDAARHIGQALPHFRCCAYFV
jgi:hypothetical protein